MFIGRTFAKAETPVLWPPHAKSWLIGKDSDAGRHWGEEEKGTTKDEMAGWHHWLNVSLSEPQELVMDREAWRAAIHSQLSDWTELNWYDIKYIIYYQIMQYYKCALTTSCISILSLMHSLSSVQSLRHVRLFATPWIAAHQASLSITNSWGSLRLTSIATGFQLIITSNKALGNNFRHVPS